MRNYFIRFWAWALLLFGLTQGLETKKHTTHGQSSKESRGTDAAAATCGWSSCPAIGVAHAGELQIWMGCLAHAADGGGSSNSSTQGKRLAALEFAGTGRRPVGDARPRRRREEDERIRLLLARRLAPVAAASCSSVERETGREGERKKGEGEGGAGSGRRSIAVAAPATGRRASRQG